jgi:hypothetical protein
MLRKVAAAPHAARECSTPASRSAKIRLYGLSLGFDASEVGIAEA